MVLFLFATFLFSSLLAPRAALCPPLPVQSTRFTKEPASSEEVRNFTFLPNYFIFVKCQTPFSASEGSCALLYAIFFLFLFCAGSRLHRQWRHHKFEAILRFRPRPSETPAILQTSCILFYFSFCTLGFSTGNCNCFSFLFPLAARRSRVFTNLPPYNTLIQDVPQKVLNGKQNHYLNSLTTSRRT